MKPIKQKYLLLIFVIVSCIMIGLSLFTTVLEDFLSKTMGSVIVPFQKGISTVGSYILDQSEQLKEIQLLIDENESLQEQVNELELQVNLLQQDKYELNRLRTLLELDELYASYEKVGARVIASDGNNWFHTFVIDKGTDDGLLEDMNVIADGGLVGLITKIGPNWAEVTSVISDNMNVSSKVLSTGDNFIVSGNLATLQTEGTINFTQLIDEENQVVVGDKIVTSDISDKYLPGLVVGYIDSIEANDNSRTKTGTVLPSVDFGHLQEVLVILDLKQEME